MGKEHRETGLRQASAPVRRGETICRGGEGEGGSEKRAFALSTDRMVVRVRDQAEVEGERAACTNSRNGWKERRCRD